MVNRSRKGGLELTREERKWTLEFHRESHRSWPMFYSSVSCCSCRTGWDAVNSTRSQLSVLPPEKLWIIVHATWWTKAPPKEFNFCYFNSCFNSEPLLVILKFSFEWNFWFKEIARFSSFTGTQRVRSTSMSWPLFINCKNSNHFKANVNGSVPDRRA